MAKKRFSKNTLGKLTSLQKEVGGYLNILKAVSPKKGSDGYDKFKNAGKLFNTLTKTLNTVDKATGVIQDLTDGEVTVDDALGAVTTVSSVFSKDKEAKVVENVNAVVATVTSLQATVSNISSGDLDTGNVAQTLTTLTTLVDGLSGDADTIGVLDKVTAIATQINTVKGLVAKDSLDIEDLSGALGALGGILNTFTGDAKVAGIVGEVLTVATKIEAVKETVENLTDGDVTLEDITTAVETVADTVETVSGKETSNLASTITNVVAEVSKLQVAVVGLTDGDISAEDNAGALSSVSGVVSNLTDDAKVVGVLDKASAITGQLSAIESALGAFSDGDIEARDVAGAVGMLGAVINDLTEDNKVIDVVGKVAKLATKFGDFKSALDKLTDGEITVNDVVGAVNVVTDTLGNVIDSDKVTDILGKINGVVNNVTQVQGAVVGLMDGDVSVTDLQNTLGSLSNIVESLTDDAKILGVLDKVSAVSGQIGAIKSAIGAFTDGDIDARDVASAVSILGAVVNDLTEDNQVAGIVGKVLKVATKVGAFKAAFENLTDGDITVEDVTGAVSVVTDVLGDVIDSEKVSGILDKVNTVVKHTTQLQGAVAGLTDGDISTTDVQAALGGLTRVIGALTEDAEILGVLDKVNAINGQLAAIKSAIGAFTDGDIEARDVASAVSVLGSVINDLTGNNKVAEIVGKVLIVSTKISEFKSAVKNLTDGDVTVEDVTGALGTVLDTVDDLTDDNSVIGQQVGRVKDVIQVASGAVDIFKGTGASKEERKARRAKRKAEREANGNARKTERESLLAKFKSNDTSGALTEAASKFDQIASIWDSNEFDSIIDNAFDYLEAGEDFVGRAEEFLKFAKNFAPDEMEDQIETVASWLEKSKGFIAIARNVGNQLEKYADIANKVVIATLNVGSNVERLGKDAVSELQKAIFEAKKFMATADSHASVQDKIKSLDGLIDAGQSKLNRLVGLLDMAV